MVIAALVTGAVEIAVTRIMVLNRAARALPLTTTAKNNKLANEVTVLLSHQQLWLKPILPPRGANQPLFISCFTQTAPWSELLIAGPCLLCL